MVFEVIGLLGLFLAIIFIIIGIAVLFLIIGGFIHFLPATIIAIVVWLLTASLFWGGVSFLVVALMLVIIKR